MAVQFEDVSSSHTDSAPAQRPLVLDLDNTLISTDLLLESVIALLRTRPIALFLLPFWFLHGMVRVKRELARRVVLDARVLPYRAEVLEYARAERNQGRAIVLATGSDERFAKQIAEHLQIFDFIFASDGVVNLCGKAKRDLLVRHFGEKGFDYIGDGGGLARADQPVYAAAHRASRVTRGAARGAKFAVLVRALRPTHWLKNVLVFVPIIAAQRINQLPLLFKSTLAFMALGCCASAGYLLNDLADLEADRRHPTKRMRPFASGDLPLSYGLMLIPMLLIPALLIAHQASNLLIIFAAVYFVMSTAYSLRLKRVAILDVLFLAGLYGMRIMAGSAATGIWSSYWLLAFSTFLFFSLALLKRYAELAVMKKVDGDAARARSYELSDAELLAMMGTASGYLSVLVLALYIASEKAVMFYSRRQLLWFVCPMLLYWISHVWLTAHRGRMPDDPVVFATRDRTSRILLLLMVVLALGAL